MASVKRDYYEVLGIDREAGEDEIKSAFHRLARDWHPDVADAPEAEARFRELAEAYGVLSKREARLLYDRYGYRGRGNLGFDEDIWEARPRLARGEDVHIDLELRRFEAGCGARRLVSYDVVVRCNACEGRGSKGLPDPGCEFCGGSGKRRTVPHLEAAELMHFESCPMCLGARCVVCGGEGTIVAVRKLRLRVPPGVEDGTQLRVRGEGDEAGAGSIAGDLLVRVSVLPPPRDPRVVRYIAVALLLTAIATLVVYLAH